MFRTERWLKTVITMHQIIYKGKPIKIKAYFSAKSSKTKEFIIFESLTINC